MMEQDDLKLTLIDLEDFILQIEKVDLGTVQYPFFEVHKRLPPVFGKNHSPDLVRHPYKLVAIDSVDEYAMDAFIDNELRTVKNTPLKLEDAGTAFGQLLVQAGRRPTHLVRVGRGLYAVVSAADLHVKVGMFRGSLHAVLINLFDKFPVFRVRKDK